MRSENSSDREKLEREIKGETYTSLLRKLQQSDTFLERFGTWTHVVAFMHEVYPHTNSASGYSACGAFCTVLHFLHCTALSALYCTFCTVLHFLHCTALSALYCTDTKLHDCIRGSP
jgi:hypothetical protein